MPKRQRGGTTLLLRHKANTASPTTYAPCQGASQGCLTLTPEANPWNIHRLTGHRIGVLRSAGVAMRCRVGAHGPRFRG